MVQLFTCSPVLFRFDIGGYYETPLANDQLLIHEFHQLGNVKKKRKEKKDLFTFNCEIRELMSINLKV